MNRLRGIKPFHGLVITSKADLNLSQSNMQRFMLKRLTTGKIVLCRKGKPDPAVGTHFGWDEGWRLFLKNRIELKYA